MKDENKEQPACTTDVAASELNVSERRICAMLKTSVLTGVKRRGIWLVHLASIEAAKNRKAGRPKGDRK